MFTFPSTTIHSFGPTMTDFAALTRHAALVLDTKQTTLAYFRQGTRPDGRLATAARPTFVVHSVLSQSAGSAQVTLGDCQVLAGVALQIGQSTNGQGDAVIVVAGGDDRPVSAARLNRLVQETIDFASLGLEQNQAWRLSIGIEVLGGDDEDVSSVEDAALLAIVAALADTQLPATIWKDQRMWIDTSRPSQPLSLPVLAVPLTMGLWRNDTGELQLLVDPTAEEQSTLVATLRIVVDATSSSTVSMQMTGDGLEPATLALAAQLAQARAQELAPILRPRP